MEGGRGIGNKQSGWAQSGGWKANRKTETEMGGMCDERLGGSGRGVENDTEGWG